MTVTNAVMLGILGLLLVEVSYLVYRAMRTHTKRKNTDIFVDTSVLMDGRILAIAETGFIPGRLVIPRSVIGEMQLLADSGDGDKREKARHGLDILKQLQNTDGIEVTILQDGSRASEGVDERLLSHAKQSGGSLATIDFNLAKVALVENITVLNINELARTLRMSYLPGEKLMIALTTTGTDSHQAVGHLGDGTMVVVEHAKKQIGKTVEIEVIRSLQTAAGRMMFARLVHPEQQPQPQKATNAAAVSQKPKAQKPQQARTQQPNGRKQTPQQASREQASKQTAQPVTEQTARSGRRHPRRSSAAEKSEASFIRLIDQQ